MSPDERQAEIAAIIQMVTTPIQHALDAQESLRKQVETIAAHYATTQERMRGMEEDIDELRDSLEEVKKAIIASQEKKFRQVIAVQGAILLMILTAAVSYLFPFIGQIIFHH